MAENINDCFQDYNEIENSDDEEKYNDLQSRLYAEIYYAPQDMINEVAETNGFDNVNVSLNDEKFDLQEANAKSDGYRKLSNDSALCRSLSNVSQHDKNILDTNNQLSDELINTEERDEHENSLLSNKQNKYKTNKSKRTLTERWDANNSLNKFKNQFMSNDNVNILHNFLIPCDNNKRYKSNRKASINQDSPEVTYIVQDQSNCETVSQPAMAHVGTPSSKSKNKVLQKYEFSKKFINKLYMDKQKKSQSETQADDEDVSVLSEKSDDTEVDTKYNVQEKNKKLHTNTSKNKNKEDQDSDSDQSIFEVPVPPKPQPLVINLQDSDEETEELNVNDASEDENLIKNNLVNESVEPAEQSSTSTSESSSTDNQSGVTIVEISNDSTSEITEPIQDIILNCTQVQKGVSSIKEIREMSKTAQNQSSSPKSTTRNETKEMHKSKSSTSQVREAGEKDIAQDKEKVANESEFNLTSTSFILDDENVMENVEAVNETVGSVDFTDDNSVLRYHVSSIKEKRKNKQDRQEKRHSLTEQCPSDEHIEDSNQRVQNVDLTEDNCSMELQVSSVNNELHMSKKRHRKVTDEEKSDAKQARHNKRSCFDNIAEDEAQYLKNFDVERIQNQMSRDPKLWAILDEDIMPFRRNRFWSYQCTNCQNFGHHRYNCPEKRKLPTCHMCGVPGHKETRCPTRMCLTCGKKQDMYRKTCESCRIFYCTTCNSVGHKHMECPDFWRRYHQTTSNTEMDVPANLKNVMKPSYLLCCCNCAKRGHESSTCKEYRWSSHFPTPPFVSNYMVDSANKNIINPARDVPAISAPNEISRKKMSQSSNLYTYSTISSTDRTGRNFVQKTMWKSDAHQITGLIEGRVKPFFLELLPPAIKFEIRIDRQNAGIEVTAFSSKGHSIHLFKLLEQWLVTDDDEKDYRMSVNIPIHDKTHFIKIVEGKLIDLKRNFGHPLYLWKEICKAKEALKSTTTDKHKVLEHLKSLQGKLHMARIKAHGDGAVKILTKEIQAMKRRHSEPLSGNAYLNVLYLYNQIYAPCTSKVIIRFIQKHKEALRKPECNKYERNLQKGLILIGTDKRRQTRSMTRAINNEINPNTQTVEIENNSRNINAEVTIESLPREQDNVLIQGTVSDRQPVNQISENLTEFTDRNRTAEDGEPFVDSNSLPSNSEEVVDLRNKISSEQNVQNVNIVNNVSDVCTQSVQGNNDNKAVDQQQETTSSKTKKRNKNKNKINQKFMRKAHETIHRAFKLSIPHLSKAAKNLMKKIKNCNVLESDVTVLEQLIRMEEEHREQVKSLYKCLK